MASKVAGSDFDEQELEAGEGGRSSIIDKLARATEAESGKDRESGSDPLSQLSKESPRDGSKDSPQKLPGIIKQPSQASAKKKEKKPRSKKTKSDPSKELSASKQNSQASSTPERMEEKTMAQICEEYGLISTYQTLEGSEALSRERLPRPRGSKTARNGPLART